jgi:hypothetical protein
MLLQHFDRYHTSVFVFDDVAVKYETAYFIEL